MKDIKLLNEFGGIDNLINDSRNIANYQGYEIPILYLMGDASQISKETSVSLNYSFGERVGGCSLKWQGSSSILFPKKNYTIKFDEAFEVVEGWGEQKKYCLKANFNDHCSARNVVCAKLWGQIVKSRTIANERLNVLPNGGAVDGFPIIISLNGNFMGLYTWNIPKDAWMFGMDGTGQQAILCAETNNNGAVYFNDLATLVEDSSGYLDFDLEYSSDGKSDWVLASLNRLIGVVKDSDGTNIQYGITPYLDWDSAIDYYIHTVLTHGYDGIHRNYLLSTYDGVKWFFTGYDMDTTFGCASLGKYFVRPNNYPDFNGWASASKLFNLIWKYKRSEVRARYNELRDSVMSEFNIATEFCNFTSLIPTVVLHDDAKVWKGKLSTESNNIAQILNFYRLKVMCADEWIKDTYGETELPPQVDPNIPTVTSISATYTGGNVEVGTALTSLIGVTVKAYYSDGTSKNVTGYTLSGTIKEGTNTITVTYEGKTTTFTVTGVVSPSYTNQVPISIDTDGSVFNGTGYVGATRLSSSGALKTVDYTSTTGYIPASSGAKIRIKGVDWLNQGSAQNYVCAYNSEFEFISAVNKDGSYGGGTVSGDSKVAIVTLLENPEIAYIRVSATHNSNDPGYASVQTKTEGPGSYLIVTVNEEITD